MKSNSIVFIESLLLSHSLKKAFFFALVGLVALFSDSLLPILAHALHVVFELAEYFVEHLLMFLFGLSEKQAQFIVFYGSLLLVIYLLWRTLSKAYQLTCLYCRQIRDNVWLYAGRLKANKQFRLAIMLLAASISL